MQIDKQALGNFVIQHRKLLGDISLRDFATRLGISHSTLLRALDTRDDSIPDTEFFLQLATLTNTNLSTVLSVAFPQAENIKISGRSRAIAEQLEQLPPETLRLVENLIFTAATKSG